MLFDLREGFVARSVGNNSSAKYLTNQMNYTEREITRCVILGLKERFIGQTQTQHRILNKNLF